ncbi:hypothetical protein HYH03_005641 [Edaphochlamys debaryana]|uniref:Pherophorin domain-containing protein n=1 Tax=Edaphochlamys debaryana TaxID=47281 RepID=A0A835YCN0_9CHLO|nr:hypothetical protein HYH03_005641 [Edaphochlamys debaryana]|eukprot:KAG2496415.1 hypothetical protein HYH03_005641 [Edaphochlamys debaryana]
MYCVKLVSKFCSEVASNPCCSALSAVESLTISTAANGDCNAGDVLAVTVSGQEMSFARTVPEDFTPGDAVDVGILTGGLAALANSPGSLQVCYEVNPVCESWDMLCRAGMDNPPLDASGCRFAVTESDPAGAPQCCNVCPANTLAFTSGEDPIPDPSPPPPPVVEEDPSPSPRRPRSPTLRSPPPLQSPESPDGPLRPRTPRFPRPPPPPSTEQPSEEDAPPPPPPWWIIRRPPPPPAGGPGPDPQPEPEDSPPPPPRARPGPRAPSSPRPPRPPPKPRPPPIVRSPPARAPVAPAAPHGDGEHSPPPPWWQRFRSPPPPREEGQEESPPAPTEPEAPSDPAAPVDGESPPPRAPRSPWGGGPRKFALAAAVPTTAVGAAVAACGPACAAA